MNYLLVTFDFPPTIGGIQTRGRHYVKEITRIGHKIVVIHLLNPKVLGTHFKSFDWKKGYNVQNDFGAVIYRFPSSIKNLFRVFLTTLRATEKTEIDVIHIFSGAYTLIGLLLLIYGRMKRKRVGISLYGKDILSSKHDLLDIILLRISLLLAERIGVNSKATASLLPRFAHGKISILYPGVDPALQKQAHERERRISDKEILFVGRLVRRKGANDVLRAFRLLQSEMPNTRLVIVGDGPHRKSLQRLAGNLGIDKKVEFTGALTGEELFKKYKECDVFTMPSRRFSQDIEGFGMVFLEAALFKKPAIGAWSGGIPEAVIHDETGLLIMPGDINALKEAMKLLLTDEELARRLGESAYKRVISKFSWKEAALKFLKMYPESSRT